MADTVESIEIEVKHKATGAAQEIQKTTSAVKSLSKVLSSIPKAAATASLNAVSKSFQRLRDRVKENIKPLQTLTKSLGRVAFYRIIRSMIKAITQAFQEGLQNAYAFSQGILGEGHRFAEAMDSMASAGQTMKNQLGSAFIALLAAIQPIVNAIIAAVTRLANAISQLFSAFTGSTYLKAAEVPKKWADAAGGAGKAAKEWKNQLLGFDEINKLQEPSDSGGGGSSAVDPSQMFKDTPISESIKKFVDDFKAAILAGDWKGAGELLGNKINELFPTQEQWATWGQKLGYGINGVIQTLYYTLRTIDFWSIGSGLATFLSNAINSIDFQYLGRLLVRKITAAIDFMLGFLTTMDWAGVGNAIFGLLTGAMMEAGGWLESKDWEVIGRNLFDKLLELIRGIDYIQLVTTFFKLLVMSVFSVRDLISGILKGVFEELIDGLKATIDYKLKFIGVSGGMSFLEGLLEPFAEAFEWIKTNALDPLAEMFSFGFQDVTAKADEFKEKIKNFFHFHDETQEAEANIDTAKAAFENLDASGTTALAQLDTSVSTSADSIASSMAGVTTATNDMWDAFLGGVSTEGDTEVGTSVKSTGVEAVITKFQEMAEEAETTGETYTELATAISESAATINDSFTSIGESWDANSNLISERVEEVKGMFEDLGSTIEGTTTANIQQFDLMSNGFMTAQSVILDGIEYMKYAMQDFRASWHECINGMIWDMLDFALYTVDAAGYVVEALLLIERAAYRAAVAMMMLSAITGMFGGGGGGGARTASVPAFASGGFPEDGLFLANHGEMVGQFSNGKTAVANNQEITEGIAQATYSAFMQAMSDSGSNKKNGEIVLNINGREFARATYDDTKEVARERGTPLVANA